eukprot:scaffold121232_cov60-Attheya_sp.AAC.1
MNVAARFFSNTRKRAQIRDGRQPRVIDDGNGSASRIFECQGHSAMLSTQQYHAKWDFVDGVGYGMFATWVPLLQIETASNGDDSEGRGYGGVGLIRHRVRCEVVGHRQSNKSTPEARKQDMPPHFFNIIRL